MRGLRDFLARSALLVLFPLGLAWAANQDHPRRPHTPVRPPSALAGPALREEAVRSLDAQESWIHANDARFLPALIDLLESPRGRRAGEAIALIFRHREITDDRGRPPVEVQRLDSEAYRRAQRRCLSEWYGKYRGAIRSAWRTRPYVADPL